MTSDEDWMVSAYLRLLKDLDDRDALTGSMALDEMVSTAPGDALRVIRRIVHEVDDADLPAVGAGPLENLLVEHGRSIVKQVEALAQKDQRFRIALRSAWLTRAHRSVRKEVERFLAEID